MPVLCGIAVAFLTAFTLKKAGTECMVMKGRGQCQMHYFWNPFCSGVINLDVTCPYTELVRVRWEFFRQAESIEFSYSSEAAEGLAITNILIYKVASQLTQEHLKNDAWSSVRVSLPFNKNKHLSN